MTKREIIATLLKKQLPERMGLHEHFWPHIIENSWKDQGIAEGTDFGTRFDLDIRNVSWFSMPAPRPELRQTVEETDEWVATRDGWGATMKNWKHKAGTPEHLAFMISSRDIWAREFRDAVLALDFRKIADLPALRRDYAAAMAGTEFVTYSSLFIFEELRRILGDVTMLESLLLDPDWIHDFNSVMTRKYIEWYEFLFAEVGKPDGVHIYEDLGYTNGPFASPACHRELVLPYHKQLFRLFKDHGLPIILHTCGEFRPHLDSIVESGADCIQAMEAKTGMNVVEMAKAYKSKLCFMGNIDIRVLESGNRKLIREECLGKLNGMKALKAPYIYMSDHSISPSVKVADYEYMIQLFREHGRL